MKDIRLVNSNGVYSIEYCDPRTGDQAILIRGNLRDNNEILDLYNNCKNINNYFEKLVKMIKPEIIIKENFL